MRAINLVLHTAHLAAALAVLLLIAWAGRSAARALRQPDVIGEITAGLLAGPAALALLGPGPFDATLPRPVLDHLGVIGKVGLVLFLTGLAHHMRGGPDGPPRTATLWVSAGALAPSLLCGALLAFWVVAEGGATVRGTASLPAFVLMTAVSLATSAVPVMAGIISARRMEGTTAGPLSLAAAVVTDSVGWLLLTAAICLDAGSPSGLLRCVQALCLGLVCALSIRYGLLSRPARSICARAPHSTAVLLGAVAVAVALAMEHLGMTAVLGAALVGLSIPAKRSAPWHRAVASVSRAGRALVPAFFVVTGVTVFNGSFSAAPWSLIALALVLGVLGKTAGGYFGARLGGQSRQVSRQVGVLMNTRGLTELIVLQVGYSTGILTAPMVLALVVMALVTTAMTGPLLSLLERAGIPSQTAPELEATIRDTSYGHGN
ncbi:cation:proton antiporter [Streptomyces sp. NPDC058240]|uniref:cation:proton antiporter n=1 Tax=Streptomyces sp. NPDC058240 TaxID=3346396 RepID=UPI0036E96BA6